MNLFRRIGIFLIGLSIGIIVLAFFFKGKGVEICYLPNCRVLKDIRNKVVTLDASVEDKGFNLEVLKPIFWKGEIIFSRSDTKSTPCKSYIIQGETTLNQQVEILVENCQSTAKVKEIIIKELK